MQVYLNYPSKSLIGFSGERRPLRSSSMKISSSKGSDLKFLRASRFVNDTKNKGMIQSLIIHFMCIYIL